MQVILAGTDGSGGRILRRRRQREIRVPNGLYGDNAGLERCGIRAATPGPTRVIECPEVHQMGNGLSNQGPSGAQRAVRRSGRWRVGPRVLAEARGHDHSQNCLQD